jgi:hypothetical protein
MADVSVRVIARFRPFNEREKKEMGSSDNSKSGVEISFPSDQTTNIRTPDNPKQVSNAAPAGVFCQQGHWSDACSLRSSTSTSSSTATSLRRAALPPPLINFLSISDSPVCAFGVFTILYRSAFASSARLQRAAPVCVT